MRAAPAVEAALGQGRVERMVITGLHAGSGAALAVWAAAHAGLGAHPFVAGASFGAAQPWLAGLVGSMVLGALGCWLARQALPAGPAYLCWNGARWQLQRRANGLLPSPIESGVPLQRVVVALDLGAWMLLQLVPADGSAPRWQVAGATGVGVAWHGLRVALQAHAGDPAGAVAGGANRSGRGPGARP
jgi:hypothetical protein